MLTAQGGSVTEDENIFLIHIFTSAMKTLLASAHMVSRVCVKQASDLGTYGNSAYFTGSYLQLGIDLLGHLLTIAFQQHDGFFQRVKELICSSLPASHSQKMAHDVN